MKLAKTVVISALMTLMLMTVAQSAMAAMSPKAEKLVNRKPAFEPAMTIVEEVQMDSVNPVSDQRNEACDECSLAAGPSIQNNSLEDELQALVDLEKNLSE